MSEPGFDREWQLADLLDAASLERLGSGLADLLGGATAIVDGQGKVLWGVAPPQARQEPLVVELEPIGFVASADAGPAALAGAARLLTAVLRAQIRYKMASTLHLEAVAEDFETLKRNHARLAESEHRYKQLSAELEKRVKSQVAQLEERQQMLYQAEKLASVGQLAAGMAHEINNPLGFLRSNLSTFQTYLEAVAKLGGRLGEGEAAWQDLDLPFIVEDGRDLLAESLKGIDRIARIVSDLKSFSNVDRASEEFTDVNSCLQHVAGVMAGQLPAGVELRLDLLPVPGMVCLPGHLNQVFFSLIQNGIQAVRDSGRSGEVRVSSAAGDDGITIRIHDNGVGMASEQLDRAFEPFYTTRSVGAGAGLGLATARNIVLAHSGRIGLESTPDVGTTVTLFFPTPK